LAITLCPAILSTAASGQTAATALPPPPALAIAKGLLAKHQYAAAVKKFSDISSSRTYRGTVWAPEAIYTVAHIQEDNLHDDNAAVASLQSLVNSQNYKSLDYPQKADVPAEITTLEGRIDKVNSKGIEWKFISFFVNLTGAKTYSYWLALVIISVVVRLILTPLTIKQYKSMREMQRLSPLLKELQAKYKDNKQVLGPKTMELYKEHGVNPAAGCVPMLLQLPIFYFMYQCVRAYQYHFTAGTFLWINPTFHARFPDIIGANLSQPDLVLLFLYAGSMYVTQRMMPQTDPTQAEMQKTTALMTSVFFFMFFQQYHYASAFVLYWLISNMLSTATQMYFMRRGDTTPPGTVVVMPSDGAGGGNGNGSNGSSNGATHGKAEGSARSMRSVQGTARGVIAPKVYPKKKRR
jgi:YidC/Oxa1 family membrane protein insertase